MMIDTLGINRRFYGNRIGNGLEFFRNKLRNSLADAIIYALFANGEQGAVYCPYDLTDEKLAWVAANPSFTSAQFMQAFPNHALFQDSLGTIPVTGHLQPLGLGLDKRFGGVRGENQNRELVVSNYTTSGTGAPVLTQTGSGLTLSNTQDGSLTVFDDSVPIITNTTYEILVTIESMSDVFYITIPFQGSLNTTLSLGKNRVIVTPTNASTLSIAVGNTSIRPSGASITISQFTIRPILGNHAHQPLSAARPLWQNNGGLKSFWFDGVDDWLDTGKERFGDMGLFADTVQRFTIFTGDSGGSGTVLARAGLGAIRQFQMAKSPANEVDIYIRSGLNRLGVSASSESRVMQWNGSVLTVKSNLFDASLSAGTSTEESGQRIIIGARTNGTGFFFQGHIYGLIIRSTLTPEDQADKIQQLLATRSGVTL